MENEERPVRYAQTIVDIALTDGKRERMIS
jgi:hypothetical protein